MCIEMMQLILIPTTKTYITITNVGVSSIFLKEINTFI